MKPFYKKKNFILLIIILIITFCISKYCIQFTLIQGDSMLPAYHSWQVVIVSKLDATYSYGDVVTFSSKTLHTTLVKRIVAMPGDTVQIINGILYVNQTPSPIQISHKQIDNPGIAATPIILADDEYFALGDNYDVSKDSRYPEIGCIKKSAVIGKVIFPDNS